MFINPQPVARNPQRTTRRRGSILIMVVALLTLMALIGTALIATARTDRYTTRAYTDAVTKDATRQQFLDQAVGMVEDVLKNDKTPMLDSPRVDTWLADRLPSPHPTNPVKPVWKYLTGRLVTSPTVTATDFPTASDYEPPFQTTYGSPASPASNVPGSSYVKMIPAAATATTANGPFFLAAPTAISITYPAAHPEESVRNQTRTFPALTFYDSAGTLVASPNTYLAGDADGDGIADSVLVRLSPTPVSGVTYYAAVRIIDNNSAVNVNTAWSRDHDFDATGGQVNPNGFFPTGVGLYELLSRNTDAVTSRVDRDNEITELNEYRFGYPKDTTPTGVNWTDSFSDYTTSTQTVKAGLSPIEDPDNDATAGNGNLPTARTDFAFTTQGEALSMQLGRRIDNPGYNTDTAYTPAATTYFPTPTAGTPFNYRGYSLTDASTAALAYRFCMVNPDASPSDVELRLRKSIYESAPNYTDYPHGAGKLPGYGFSSDTKVHHWSAFPANEADLWFQYLNYTSANPAVDAGDPANTQFTPTRAAGNTGPALTGPTQFRSVRPLLTTYSAVSNLVPAAYRWTNDFYAWNHGAVGTNSTNIYPGMLPSDMSNVAVTTWAAGGTHKMYDMVRDPHDGLTYMRVSDTAGDMQPYLDTNFQYWEPQPLVTGHAKTNVNLAGFPELWRAFFSTIYNATGSTQTVDGGTPVDQAYMGDVTAWTGTAPTTMSQAFYPNPSGSALQAYDIYHGMHWVESYPVPPAVPTYAPQPNAVGGGDEVNTLRMFRSTIRDPRAISPYPAEGLHRLTPYQMMALRSAIAAVNVKQLLSPTKNTTVASRTITLYDVDPAATNGAPDPAVGGTPAANNPVPQYEVTVYGNAPQPYITEVFASNDTYDYKYTDIATSTTYEAQNPKGYVAIELYNPYDTAISLDGFTILSLPRDFTTYDGNGVDVTSLPPSGRVIKDFPAASGLAIPAHGYLILEGYDTTNATSYRHPAAQFTTGAPTALVPELTKLIGSDGYTPSELVLLRPRTLGATTDPIEDKVPVDQFDFTGFPAPTAGATQMTSWHYARSTNGWQFVYPGRYDASSTNTNPRHQGVHQTYNATTPTDHTYTPTTDDPAAFVIDPWVPDSPALVNEPFKSLLTNGTKAYTPYTEDPAVTLGGANVNATYCIATLGDIAASIQLANVDMPGRNPVVAGANAFPFGGFARDGDILQVPYIGSYRIRRLQRDPAIPVGSIDRGALVDSAATVLEFNSVTMDAAFAEDTDATNNTGSLVQENVGRFTPVTVPPLVYDWTKNLYTYLTTQGAPLDYLPDTSPYTYPPGVADPHKFPKPVPNKTGGTVATANDVGGSVNEDLVPSQGKININTAPFRVLASLPIVPDGTGGIDVTHTEEVANAIVTYRDTAPNGNDFRSIFDLNKVTNFQQGGLANVLSGDPSDLAGDYSGSAVNSSGSPDGVRFDFEEQYLLMNRISNLITTKSDTYTVYILVQGWRNAGTPYPVLDWEQRIAYIMDRSSGTVRKVAIPTD